MDARIELGKSAVVVTYPTQQQAADEERTVVTVVIDLARGSRSFFYVSDYRPGSLYHHPAILVISFPFLSASLPAWISLRIYIWSCFLDIFPGLSM